MLLMGVTEGREGDTEIVTPLLRVDPGTSTDLAFSEDAPVMAGDAALAVGPPAVVHRRSNVNGLR